jgi:hypothetical protein
MSGAGPDGQDDMRRQQSWMLAAISATNAVPCQADVDRHLHSSEGLDAAARLGIYRRAYRTRLLQSFHAIFPGLLRAMGAEVLDAFALAFLAHHRPHHYSINRVADDFAAYLQDTRPAREPTVDWPDFIIDLARLETALLQVSESAGLESAAPPCRDLILRWSDERLSQCRPLAAPCLRLLECRYPVQEYLDAVRTGHDPPLPEPRSTHLALTRVHFRLSMRELAVVQWRLLQCLNGSTTLAQALQSIAELRLRPAPSLELARVWLGNFTSQGLVAQVAARSWPDGSEAAICDSDQQTRAKQRGA